MKIFFSENSNIFLSFKILPYYKNKYTIIWKDEDKFFCEDEDKFI